MILTHPEKVCAVIWLPPGRERIPAHPSWKTILACCILKILP
ncbi:MAG: hypothetical protein ACSW8H_00400 [bacterium]